MSDNVNQHLSKILELKDEVPLYFIPEYFLSEVVSKNYVCTRQQLAMILDNIISDKNLCLCIKEYDVQSQQEIASGAFQASDEVRRLNIAMHEGLRNNILNAKVSDPERLMSVLLAHVGYYIQN